jgi:hypothetical protein
MLMALLVCVSPLACAGLLKRRRRVSRCLLFLDLLQVAFEFLHVGAMRARRWWPPGGAGDQQDCNRQAG